MLRLVLVEPEGEYNVGFIARLCKNFEVNELFIVRPKCNINSAIKFSARGEDILRSAKIVDTYEEALQGTGIKIATSSIANNKGDILRKAIFPWELSSIMKSERVALIFGRESVGLTREEISKADFLLFIPANPAYPTLNLSHAVGIVLYEIWKAKHEIKPKMTKESIDLLDKYSKILYGLIRKSDEDYALYIALKRALIKGINDEEEARTVIKFLRKLYTKFLHEDKE
ncbi:tRNA (cytidine-2'-O-)-methyltransferase TrmJ [Acidianus sp. HS-5]|uniref:tRNA (cytidine-2'-O-)-methyltransferase TrmJ n=1 Tax=Acidianus sp. HS-5 TaxID=2886040 RepID=UPI001F2AF0F6|nr:tRNA (cytidine-2'-O-)-methyltransferase TrmJ [Acidianus sp. HS-5]BDC19304.1 RNA methyltransferase [Acidianus sp. HS-5]